MKTTIALALAACLVAGSASGQEAPSIPDASFRASMALDGYARVEYRDADGKPIAFADFMKAVAAGGSFSMTKESDHSLAVVKVSGATAEKPPVAHGPGVGKSLPALDAGMKTLDGQVFSDAGLRGHRTLLSLFFSECVPCIAEVPALNAFAKAHPEVPVYSITFDDAATAREFVGKRGLEVPVVADAQDYLDRMHVDTYPMLLLVDAQGKIAAVRSGGGTGESVLTADALASWIGGVD
jgi:cytochrome oxidase Cu insertion factor (SCO1/SenC/PrrC family)